MNLAIAHMAAIALASCLLSACAVDRPTAHEQSLGYSVRQAQAEQLAHPAEVQANRPPSLDGVAAAHGIERYHQSFARPQAPMNVLNILTGAGTSSSAMPPLPR